MDNNNFENDLKMILRPFFAVAVAKDLVAKQVAQELITTQTETKNKHGQGLSKVDRLKELYNKQPVMIDGYEYHLAIIKVEGK